MRKNYDQKPGTRIKEWDLGESPRAAIEATAESPVVYKWLGTEPRTEHPFNVYGDILSQPKALRDTFALNRDVIPDLARRLVDRGYAGMVGYGLGTSQYAPKTALGSFWSYAGWDARDLDSLEYTTCRPPLDLERSVAMAYSGSGSTVDSVRAARLLKDQGAYQIAFTSVAASPITEICDETIVCAGGFDTGGSDTFHYTTRVMASVWLALEIGALRQPDARDWAHLRRRLHEVPNALEGMIGWTSARAQALSARYKDVRSVFVVGSGPNEGLAEEIALKYDEMSHIPAKAMCPGRHLHGALGTTTHDILTIVVAPEADPNYAALRDVAQATMMLKAPSIALVSEADTAVVEQVDDVFRLPETDPVLFSLLAILPGQLLAYFAGVARGDVNPDCQRANLARHAKVWHWLFPKGAH
jgi:glucosamine 6-phosphate synthetase-like amidotransferase/phosphosugar isomerase protein